MSLQGVFPLDRLHECETTKNLFLKCMHNAGQNHSMCRKFSLFYLSCRQNRGLMEETAVDELGFTEEANLKAKKAALNNNHGQKNREDRVAGMHIRATALEQKGNLNG